jgi:hypothetical protein
MKPYIGQKVRTIKEAHGVLGGKRGEIFNIDVSENYPIKIKFFDNTFASVTYDGRYFHSNNYVFVEFLSDESPLINIL